jgi:hypothetical protein
LLVKAYKELGRESSPRKIAVNGLCCAKAYTVFDSVVKRSGFRKEELPVLRPGWLGIDLRTLAGAFEN